LVINSKVADKMTSHCLLVKISGHEGIRSSTDHVGEPVSAASDQVFCMTCS